MNTKQKTALEIIAQWADRFECVTSAVIYGSVARSDEAAGSDLDVDLEYVPDLTAPGMVGSYKEVQDSFAGLSDKIKREVGHRLKLSNYVNHRLDHAARDWIKCGTEVGSRGKARIVSTAKKP